MDKIATRDIVGISFLCVGTVLAFAVSEHTAHVIAVTTMVLTLLFFGVMLIGNK